MKKYFSLICLLTILFSGCNQEELLNNQSTTSESRTFTASFDQNESRTYVEEGNLLRWTKGDQISLFVESTLNSQYQFDGETGDNAGTFSPVSQSFGTGNDLTAHYAVYPYASSIKISDSGIISATLPAEQSYAENSFGVGDNTMVAVTQNTNDMFLKFKNVGGYLKLQLYGDDVTIKSITLKGNNKEKLAGKASITPVYGEDPTISMAEDATETITYNCGDGVKIGSTKETATAFWIVVPPTTFEKGFTITIMDINGFEFTKSTSNEISINRNVIKPMSAIKINPKMDYLLKDFNPNQYIKYVSNYEQVVTNDDASKPDIIRYTSYISCPSTSISKMEIKFQMVNTDNWIKYYNLLHVWSSGKISLDADQMKICGNTYSWNDLEVGISDIMVLSISYKDKSIKLNGIDLDHNIASNVNTYTTGGYFLSAGYSEDYDDGWLREWKAGVSEGSKLYYVKFWNENDELIYLGTASTALNQTTNEVENCWCSYYNGDISYQFAHNSTTLTSRQPYGGGID